MVNTISRKIRWGLNIHTEKYTKYTLEHKVIISSNRIHTEKYTEYTLKLY